MRDIDNETCVLSVKLPVLLSLVLLISGIIKLSYFQTREELWLFRIKYLRACPVVYLQLCYKLLSAGGESQC